MRFSSGLVASIGARLKTTEFGDDRWFFKYRRNAPFHLCNIKSDAPFCMCLLFKLDELERCRLEA